MENASRALLIAGGILIAIVILSVGVYLYAAFSNQSKEYSQIIQETEIQKYNSKFDVYIGREDVTAQEIVSIVNLAKEYGDLIEIIIYNKGYVVESFTKSEEFIIKFQKSYFSCIDSVYDNNTGKLIKLTFKENS